MVNISAEDLAEVEKINTGDSKSLFKPKTSSASHLLKDNLPEGNSVQ